MRNRVIGFCGPIGCGKSTAARILMERFGYRRERFAEPLKAMLRALGLEPEEIDGAAKENPAALLGGKTPRFAMQTLGTEWGRQLIDPELWVRAWQMRVGSYWRRYHAPVAVDDVRFPNEVAAIQAMGGLVVRIERERSEWPKSATADVRRSSGEAEVRGAHASELQPIAADFTILNGGSLDDLDEAVCRLPNRGAA